MLTVNIEKTEGSFTLQTEFTVEQGILGILGPSGCGKSLTLQCIAGLRNPDKGNVTLQNRVLFDSHSSTNVPSRSRNIGYMFQNYALFPHLTVAENIAFGLKHVKKKEQKQLVADMVKKLNLQGQEKQYPSNLSGGQQQRVALGRSLITNPQLILLDEPFSALDRHLKNALQEEIFDLIHNLFRGIAILVTHDMEEAYRLCNQILVYDNGRILQSGSKDEILERPATITLARMMGCKNIVEGHIVQETSGQIEVRVGSVPAIVDKNRVDPRILQRFIEGNVKVIVGIHSYDIDIVRTTNESGNCNIIDWKDTILTTIFTIECAGRIFLVELSKERAICIKKNPQDTYQLRIPTDKILLIKNG
ncbi:hypothetical protein BHU72_07125 [Desulfuribacillus stibiiarsenatis]|uniref:ABC-type quaternary amine transporter n=1 Tax=Desulfuribacillus stibiiarsenatis TaxID=1390249 RepID=A0A1E5L4D5_9FIRM|nr:ABC transporter ATP-binding protein [Desulfuribacillus stibiiarsenatis]OEH84956.1 hypothetical protein BHU72_07125 [Desulfuribacillus stibiiarsenatis]